MNTRWSTRRAARNGIRAASHRTIRVGGRNVAASANTTMSTLVFPRATKNSGSSASTSNSGFATAKAQSTAR